MGKIKGESFKDGFKLGYQLGAFVEIDVNKNWGIQPELLFSQSKTKVAENSADVVDGLTTGQNIDLNYLSIPVLLRLNAGKLITFHLGPQYSILVNNHKTTAGNAINAFKEGDLAAVAGAQVNLGALKVYGRYNVGLSNISNIGNTDKWQNQQLQLGLGLRIL
jgi:opacity protein-like surface antigen